jgi:peptidoglycan-N-acetylglucosamine deacetylase
MAFYRQSLRVCLAAAVTAFGAFATPALAATECASPKGALGVDRVVEIDTAAGPLYGDISLFTKEDSFLAPKEVVLTFDDGPMPWITKSILDTLDQYCTKATFFSVGRMAIAYPASVKDILQRGHTLGGHTWSHPLNLKRLGLPIAPFFRFPGLSDSDPMLAHLQGRGIGTFTVDVVSNDSYIGDANRLVRYTMEQVERRNGGIMLFHDIKAATAKALPEILRQLHARGYKVVHMTSKTPLNPVKDYDDVLLPMLNKAGPDQTVATSNLLPFYGATSVFKTLAGTDAAVTSLAPPARERKSAPAKRQTVADDAGSDDAVARPKKTKARVGGWTARTKPEPRPRPAQQPAATQWSPNLFGF